MNRQAAFGVSRRGVHARGRECLLAALPGLALALWGCATTTMEQPGEDASTGGDLSPENNTTCAMASTLTLQGGKAAVSSSTATSTNEYGSSIHCGLASGTLQGPQRYYRVELYKGQSYRFTLASKYAAARMYIFAGCGVSLINKDCSSKGATGAVSASVDSGQSASLLFQADADRSYYVAVDGTLAGPSAGGAFSLTIEAYSATVHGACAGAKTLSLASGKVLVQDTTEGAANEFGTGINCGSATISLAGPQVYYRVALTGGKPYLVSLIPGFPGARLVSFGTTCSESAINADCGSKGKSGDVSGTLAQGSTYTTLLSPQSSGEVTLSVDSTLEYYYGSFTLSVEEYLGTSNALCKSAETLTLTGGKVTVQGSTLGKPNEFGSGIQCGESGAASGPQAYYQVSLVSGKSYTVTLTPTFPARLYLFGGSCTAAQIDTDCASKGLSGDHLVVYSGSSATLYFRASSSSPVFLAVDSGGLSYYGTFQLEIAEYTPTANGTCAAAKPVSLGSSPTLVSGDTTAVPNEFGATITCGSTQDVLWGSQLYYQVGLTAGKTTTFTLTSGFSAARLFIFGTTCTAAAINTDCGSGGKTGALSGYVTKGIATDLTFTPSASGTYTVAVDATSTAACGTFQLQIQ